MSWLLNNASRGRRRRGTRWPNWNRAWTPVVLKSLGGLGLVAAAVWGWHRAERSLHTFVASHRAIQVRADQVVLENAPAWMGKSIRTQLQQLASDQARKSPLDHRRLKQAAATLEQIAWIQQVHQIRLTADKRLFVNAEYRRPVAIVQGRDGYHLVDSHCCRLPGLYLHQAAHRLGLPVIIGVSEAPTDVGQIWSGQDLAAGVKLATVLEYEPYMDQVAAIDVSGRDQMGRVHLVLRTHDGIVRWGLMPGREYPIEPSAHVKKELLLRVADEYGGLIDAGGHIVDIYDGNILLHTQPSTGGAVHTGYTTRH